LSSKQAKPLGFPVVHIPLVFLIGHVKLSADSMRDPDINSIPYPCMLALLFLCLGSGNNANGAERWEQVGKKAPAWELTDLAGKTQKLDGWKGKIIVLNFWTTWCPPCRAEIPDFMSLHEAYKDRNVVFIGVSLDTGLGPVKRYVRTQKLNYPVVMGNSQLVSDYGNFSGIPQTFVIDTEGRIHKQFQGVVQKKVLEQVMLALSASSPKPSK
jgi:peroxiredoxin